MSKVLILAPTGFGKSTSIGNIPELGIKGLDPSVTYLFTVKSKPLPFRGSNQSYKITTPKGSLSETLKSGNRYISNNAKDIAEGIKIISKNPKHTNIVLDDANYIMQDYYMKNALKSGWDKKCVLFLRN